MNHERILQALKALAENDRAREAPPGVEARLRREFRHDRAKRAWRRRAMWSGAAAAVAAILVVTHVAPRRGEPSPARPVPLVEAVEPVHASPPIPSRRNSSGPVSSGTAPARRTAHATAITRGEQASRAAVPTVPATPTPRPSGVEETTTDFFPLIDPAPPFERGELLRVNLPASVMRTVGLPVREERLGDRIQADVLVGEEGLPRAIRFVRADTR